jgi:(2R)-ethylmalonyl-CoA mutase
MTAPTRGAAPSSAALPKPDKPWLFRTYAGHSTASKSNELYRKNLAKGQTGLSIAFDLPTQTGYDSDHELARGEVGKVGVPVSHLGDMRALFAGCWRSTSPSPTSRARTARRSPAPSRTTSSRSISRAAPTCSRPRPRSV